MRLGTRGLHMDETESHPPCNTNECAPSRQFDVAGAQAEDVKFQLGPLHCFNRVARAAVAPCRTVQTNHEPLCWREPEDLHCSDEPSGSLHKRLTQDSSSDVLTVD